MRSFWCCTRLRDCKYSSIVPSGTGYLSRNANPAPRTGLLSLSPSGTKVPRLRAAGVEILPVTTTNDNLNALRFYQRRGFRITEVRPRAVDDARRLKPSIPIVGEYGIPIRDEIELERRVQNE
jgi:hypothetical protein